MIIEFIQRRFGGKDCDWKTGNCYFFAVILKSRFPSGDIYYDTIAGHFVFKLHGEFYDYEGRVESFYDIGAVIKWDEFEEYDPILKARIVRDCII